MSLFRRRRNANTTKVTRGDGELSKDVLQGQVDGLQAEMERLNQRLVAMQAKVQTSTTMGLATSNNDVSQRVYPETFLDRPPVLRRNEPRLNHAVRKQKGHNGVFNPYEIHFISNENSSSGNETNRPEITVEKIFSRHKEASFPVPKVVTTKQRDLVSESAHQTESIGRSHSLQKPVKVYRINDARTLTHGILGDGESIGSGQKSTHTIRNGRKVRRIVRKVRAVRREEHAIQQGSKCLQDYSTYEGKQKKTDANPSKSYQNEEKLAVIDLKESSHQFMSAMTLASAGNSPKNDGLKYCVDSEPKDKGKGHTSKTLSSASRTDYQHHEAQAEKRRNNAKEGKNPGDILANIEVSVNLSSTEAQVSEAKVSRYGNLGNLRCTQSNDSGTIVKAASETKIGLLADIQTGVKLRRVQNPNTSTETPSNPLMGGIKAGVNLKPIDNTLPKVPSSTPNLLSEIRAGVTLKITEKKGIESPIQTNPILESIKAGVKLKEVDKSSVGVQRKHETPMSALLAKIQERKEECLRRNGTALIQNDDNEIDW